MQTGLDQVLALGLCDERLKLGCCEGVDESSFRDHQQKDLCACQCAQLVRLFHNAGLALGKCNMAPALVLNVLNLDLATSRSLPALGRLIINVAVFVLVFVFVTMRVLELLFHVILDASVVGQGVALAVP